MNCRCASSLLSAYVDGELTGREMLSVRSHVSACGQCARELEDLRSLKRLLGSMGVDEPRAQFEEALVARVISSDPLPSARSGSFRLALVTCMVAAVAVFAGLQVLDRPQETRVATDPPVSFSVERDQAYLAGADPIIGHAPVYTVSDASR